MKNKFKWYFKPSTEEMTKIWENGILTVDTNVLLDLYRYHKSTRDSLLQSIMDFKGEKWLSHQASIEFLRNRTKVIISAEKTFKQAHEETESLEKILNSTISNLKGNRIIPTEIAGDLQIATKTAIDLAKKKIAEAKEIYPKFLQSDSLLEQIADVFNNSIGNDFKEEEMDNIKKEAEFRKINTIPPGYLDKEKDGDRPYGDFYLWKQILEHAKNQELPIILVTSETSDDWWERISGKTTGPRPELLIESMEISGQRVLIYQTENFLKTSLERAHKPINEIALEEIRLMNKSRDEHLTAVQFHSQKIDENETIKNRGILTIELMRSVSNFTASGHFEPKLSEVPKLQVSLLSHPPELPASRIGAGTGTKHDFNIHLGSTILGTKLPPGMYSFSYLATTNISNENEESPIDELIDGKFEEE
ncbi:PIN-like domain-containing protein [Janthinobacterium sp. UMAB-60]|uniref:PIN-like domain-containing protein n=1 Tax=Janthinobacterium sp. UMAB-60 TaxID=1365365 RepID=UPI001C59D0FA|nr:PIN-like domain-containing protein [Janthinobacterium sp. UMAB-60]